MLQTIYVIVKLLVCSFKYKFLNSVERSSFECQEEASGAAKS